MSYILDALKKADAEREREGVPSLQTQHVAAPNTTGSAGEGAATGLRWAAAGIAGGFVLLAGLWWLRPTLDGVQTPSPAQAMPQAALPLPAQMPVAPAPALVTPPAPTQPPAAMQALPRHPLPTAEPSRREATRKADAGIHVDASLRDAPVRVVPVAELPDEVRRELPALSIGGAMHSDVPANRMLVLNGAVFHEGDQPAAGLVLEEIKLKSAVFRFKGHRYSVAY